MLQTEPFLSVGMTEITYMINILLRSVLTFKSLNNKMIILNQFSVPDAGK